MSGQTYYFQHTVTGNYFVWVPEQNAFVGCTTDQAISPNAPERARLVAVTPRTVAPGLPGNPANLSTPSSSGRSYTHRAHEIVSPSDVSAFNDVRSGPQGCWLPQQGTASNTASAYGQQRQQYDASDMPVSMANLSLGRSSNDRRPSGPTFNTGPVGIPTNAAYVERGQRAGSTNTGQTPISDNRADQGDSQVASAHRVIQRGYEPLDTRYKRREHSFYKVGRVFMVHWSEPASNETIVTKVTEVLPKEYCREPKHGLKVYSKIRRFIVVRCGDRYSNCVRITTYNGSGAAKPGVNITEHAIAYCEKHPPGLLPEEVQAGARNAMRREVRISPDEKGDKLDQKSRIDYGRVYAVEHNVLARSFGNVHENSMKDFYYNFQNVQNPSTNQPPAPPHEASSGNPGPISRRSENVNPPIQGPTYTPQPQSNPSMTAQPQVSYSAYQTNPQSQTRPANQRQAQPRRRGVSASHYGIPSYRARPRGEASDNEYDEE